MLADWYERQAPHCAEPHPFRIECKHEGGTHGRYRLTAYIGDRFVHSAFYDWNVWLGHAHGQLLMPDFIEAAKRSEAATLRDALDDYQNACAHSADDLRARDATIAALEARVRELEEYQRVAEMFQQLVIGEGAWERFQALTARAEQAEAALSVAQKDAAKHLATVYGAWTNHRSIDGNEDNQVVILTMKETNDLHDFLESIAHGGAGEGENG